MIYINGRIIPRDKAVISVFDHGFLYGDGIYETLRAYKGVVFKFHEHIDRLFRSAFLLDLIIPISPDAIKKAVYKTMAANRLKEAVIRITISRGPGPTGLDPDLCPKPTLVIFANKFKEYPEQYYKKGIKIAIADTRRNYRKAIDPQIKSLNFLNNVLAKIEAKKRNAYEAIMLNYKGHIAEGTITNIFFTQNSVLCTPSLKVGILDGITRRIILEAAKKLKIETREGRFKPDHIYNAQEVFVSNTTMEVMPVAEINNAIKFNGPGNITNMLRLEYKKKVTDYINKKGDKCLISPD
jgi:branched-chain amino acid aminotransferase